MVARGRVVADGRPSVGKPQMRARVLKAAMVAIAEVGPDRVRVQDIADRAGMSTGHVLYYFGRRDRILIDTLLLSEVDLAAVRDRRLARTPDAWAAVDVLARLYLADGPTDVRWKLWAQLIARPPTDAQTVRAFAEVIDSWGIALENVIRRGVATGVMRTDDPAEVAYRTCRCMDGLSLEILLATRGRSRAWAVRLVNDSVRRELATTGD
ncbi:MAG: TetR family transcriptional regulator C-terminal domain-containing protein [Actinobacteria bacterium]|jgi:AcrR family transcriptional regulator|nr:TetR family transcriptional regulator C-terminal domain-containing protein [Actinomycetota bacterium]